MFVIVDFICMGYIDLIGTRWNQELKYEKKCLPSVRFKPTPDNDLRFEGRHLQTAFYHDYRDQTFCFYPLRQLCIHCHKKIPFTNFLLVILLQRWTQSGIELWFSWTESNCINYVEPGLYIEVSHYVVREGAKYKDSQSSQGIVELL